MAVTYASKPCCDPLALAAACREQGVPADWLDRANTFAVPLGRGPGRGWVLLLREDLDAVSRAADHDLVFGDDRGNRTTLKKVVLLGAHCVAPGLKGSGSQAYLCDLADRRHHLGRIPIDKGYNVRSADGTTRLPGTLTAGVAWTWQQVVQDLATALGIGTLTLPFTPDGTPENLCYYGFWAWPALCDVLDRVGCAVRYFPAEDTFSVVRLGVADAAGDAEADRLERGQERTWDADPTDPERAWRPEKVRVRFVRRPEPTDGSSPYWAVDVTLAAGTGVVTGSYVQVDDDLSALGSTGTPTNGAALATRAGERAADWLRKRQGYDAPELVVYRDVQPRAGALLGSTRGAVAFDDRAGPRTQVRNTPDGAMEGWGPFARVPKRWPPGGFELLLVEVTVSNPPGSGTHTVKRKTRGGGNLVTDYSPATTYTNVVSATGGALPVGTLGYLDPIPDAAGYYWLSPNAAYATNNLSTLKLPGLVSHLSQVVAGPKYVPDGGQLGMNAELVVSSVADVNFGRADYDDLPWPNPEWDSPELTNLNRPFWPHVMVTYSAVNWFNDGVVFCSQFGESDNDDLFRDAGGLATPADDGLQGLGVRVLGIRRKPPNTPAEAGSGLMVEWGPVTVVDQGRYLDAYVTDYGPGDYYHVLMISTGTTLLPSGNSGAGNSARREITLGRLVHGRVTEITPYSSAWTQLQQRFLPGNTGQTTGGGFSTTPFEIRGMYFSDLGYFKVYWYDANTPGGSSAGVATSFSPAAGTYASPLSVTMRVNGMSTWSQGNPPYTVHFKYGPGLTVGATKSNLWTDTGDTTFNISGSGTVGIYFEIISVDGISTGDVHVATFTLTP